MKLSLIKRIVFAVVLLAFCFPGSVRAERKGLADWCQCAIFVVNYLGLDIIPGDYFTAGSFVVPDSSGITWMEYQGFKERNPVNVPQRGDVVVIKPNGQVFFREEPGSSNLVLVNVDAWAGHIGIIESAEKAVVNEKEYWQVTLLSSNWGVNATSPFVKSSCFNVDRSEILIAKDDSQASFWYQDNIEKQRTHILNLAKQLANGNYHVSLDKTIDGYPIIGAGMVGYVWKLEMEDGLSPDAMILDNSNEIPKTSIQPGDVLFLPGMQKENSYGFYAGYEFPADENEKQVSFAESLTFWFDRSSNTLQWPKRISDIFTPKQIDSLVALRLNSIKAVPEIFSEDLISLDGSSVVAGFMIRNNGGQPLLINQAYVQGSNLQGEEKSKVSFPAIHDLEIPAGQEYLYYENLKATQNGVYKFEPVLIFPDKKNVYPEFGETIYIQSGLH